MLESPRISPPPLVTKEIISVFNPLIPLIPIKTVEVKVFFVTPPFPTLIGGPGRIELWGPPPDPLDPQLLYQTFFPSFVGSLCRVEPSNPVLGQTITLCAENAASGGTYNLAGMGNFYDDCTLYVNNDVMNNIGGTSCTNMAAVGAVNVPVTMNVRRGSSVISQGNYTVVLPCIAYDSLVHMADGSFKPIYQVQRGDWVRGDVNDATVKFRVARVLKAPFANSDHTAMVTIEPNALGPNQPSRRLTMTGYHPVVYRNARREARALQSIDGVTYHPDTQISKFVQSDALYDLQFEVEGTFVANNATVQSRSPCYAHDPLPRGMFFDAALYHDARSPGTVDHPIAFDGSIL